MTLSFMTLSLVTALMETCDVWSDEAKLIVITAFLAQADKTEPNKVRLMVRAYKVVPPAAGRGDGKFHATQRLEPS